ncbi:hypothetical protein SALWKB12_0253 [Snodgrassella communis]|nr:hypothetical protein SALWKB12_0253 [Snodgrassella communis]
MNLSAQPQLQQAHSNIFTLPPSPAMHQSLYIPVSKSCQ